jgi:hypothetical protein
MGNQSEANGANADSSSTLRATSSASSASLGASSMEEGGGNQGSGARADAGLANASCDALEQTLRQEVAAGYAAASTACQIDGDCMLAADVGCYHSCGGPIVSRAGNAAAQAALLADTAPVCSELTQRCGPRPAPSCPFPGPTTLACNDGTCGLLSCDGLLQRIGPDLDRIVQNLSHQCTSDDDCTVINTSVSCLPDCGRYQSVRVGDGAWVREQVQNAGNMLCLELESRQCAPVPVPSCPAIIVNPRAACVAGQCAFAAGP